MASYAHVVATPRQNSRQLINSHIVTIMGHVVAIVQRDDREDTNHYTMAPGSHVMGTGRQRLNGLSCFTPIPTAQTSRSSHPHGLDG